MEDEKIVALYWDRSETAIRETQIKYGRLLHSLSLNILKSRRDAEECVNDTYLGAWNSMPPHRPSLLRAFLCRLTRNISLNRYDYNRAEKRNPECLVSLEELYNSLSLNEDPVEELVLEELINSFLDGLPAEQRDIFLRRYWCFDSIRQIAARYGCSESRVTSLLFRARAQLREHLRKGGVSV